MKKTITLVESGKSKKRTSSGSLLIACLLTIFLASCATENAKSIKPEKLILQKTDSILVDYEGVFYLRDYHPEKDVFLAEDYQNNRLIEFNRDGDIEYQINWHQDGPDRLEAYPAGINYVGDSIAFILPQNQIMFLNKSAEITGKIPFETGSFYMNGLTGDNIFKLGDNFAYLRPENSEMIENYDDLFGSVYSKPILEIFEASSKQRKYTMPFPTGSIYQPGSYRFWTFPTIKKRRADYFLFFHAEPWFYHYKQIENDILFHQKVPLPDTKFVQRKAVSMNQSSEYWDINGNIIEGRITGLYPLEKGIMVIYRKGMDENITSGYNTDDREVRRLLDDNHNPYLWAFFDYEMGAIAWNQACPEGIIWTSSYTKNGEIVGMKDQEFHGKEEKHQTFYLYKPVQTN